VKRDAPFFPLRGIRARDAPAARAASIAVHVDRPGGVPMETLTVATFNTQLGLDQRAGRAFDVVEVCRALDADVVALQEVWRPDGEVDAAARAATALGYDIRQATDAHCALGPRARVVRRWWHAD